MSLEFDTYFVIYLGTTGWAYSFWSDFYPKSVSSQLQYFAERIHFTEVNTTFYKIPSRSTVENWNNSTPPDFVFAVKMFRELTHERSETVDRELLEEFMGALLVPRYRKC